jgi:serralysin
MANENKWCFAWFEGEQNVGAQSRAALVKKNKWDVGGIINVAFLDGDERIEQKVQKVAKKWTGPKMANLRLSFIDDAAKADIRISFQYSGSWSTIGTTCRNVADNQPTMNYGWLTPGTSDAELRRVVLHEFGHAFGLIHEHQNPLGRQIPWDKKQVEQDLSGPPNNWDKATIQHNMFEAYKKNAVNGTGLDKASIMMYPIPATWVTDPKYAVGLNDNLSPADKKFIHQQYRGDG